ISEAHCGAEYPTDLQSGIDCLHGLIDLIRFLPSEVFAEREFTKFLISKGSQAEGTITPESFERHMKSLQCEYIRLVERDEYNYVLGEPSVFWRKLEVDEYSCAVNVAEGYVSVQRSIDPLLLGALLKTALI